MLNPAALATMFEPHYQPDPGWFRLGQDERVAKLGSETEPRFIPKVRSPRRASTPFAVAVR